MTRAWEALLPAGPDPARGSPDAILLEGCRAGNRVSFEELYRVHGARMKSVAARVLGDRAEAEDAVQDAFVNIFRSAAAFEGRSRFSTWIYRVVVNACHDRLRRRRETVPLDPPGAKTRPSPRARRATPRSASRSRGASARCRRASARRSCSSPSRDFRTGKSPTSWA